MCSCVRTQEHTYNVQTDPPQFRQERRIENPVQFTVHHIDMPEFECPAPALLALPNPRYLEIHGACCKVACMSGATDYLDKMRDDVEEIGVLAEDGGSAEVLLHAMSRLQM